MVLVSLLEKESYGGGVLEDGAGWRGGGSGDGDGIGRG